jgi:hypothetical protein
LALQDADDQVRILTATAIWHNAPCVIHDTHWQVVSLLPHRQGQQQQQQSRQMILITAETQRLVQLLTFDQFLSRLLRVFFVELLRNPSQRQSDFIDLLDTSLRTLCVLDATTFETVVRRESVNYSDPNATSEEEIREFINGLVNHASLLQTMQMQHNQCTS